MKKLPHFILELANFHGGNPDKIIELINKYSKLNYNNLGIKFQAFKYNKIALPDYDWYDVYKKLFITKNNWGEIIRFAYDKISKVWLDIFDLYGIEILEKNMAKIYGIKLQASVLNNGEIISSLSKMDLSNKELIINISGYELSEIEDIISNFNKLKFKKIILQIGFQNYPTNIKDTSLRKIEIIKNCFPEYEISFADHISAKDKYAQTFPIYACLKGCTYIEKHVCLNRSEAVYDYFSALEYKEIEKILEEIKKVRESYSSRFIPITEKIYLEKTIEKPMIKNKINPGQIVSKDDLIFRRTNKIGITIKKINEIQSNFYILNKELNKYSTLNVEDFKKAKIGVIVAVRMKSSRLKNKAILPIYGVPSIERCLQNCLKFKSVNEFMLATSTVAEDDILKNYTLGGKVKFWQGDPDDVISRYIGACEKYNIDIVIRVTGDCPVISPEIAELLLKSHFKEGADYTATNKCAVGSACEIYNVEALKRIILYFGKANYSEYMTWYMRNNPNFFKINIVDLPDDLVRNYRLTLDFQEDLDMFNLLFQELDKNNCESTLINIFKIVDSHPEIIHINSHIKLRYKEDKQLIENLNKVTKIR